jgi:curved DNA-binding protein CbpA
MTSYFYDCKTKDEAKAKYRKLAKELHPDHGGNADRFKDMQSQYDGFKEENPFKTMYEEDLEAHGFGEAFKAYRQGSTFYGYGNRGSTTTDGRGFNQFYNGNAFKAGHRDIPSDHPIHYEMANLKSSLSKAKEELHLLKNSNICKYDEIQRQEREIEDLKKNSVLNEEKIRNYEMSLQNVIQQAQYWKSQAEKRSFWMRLKQIVGIK